ncbi:tetratricopeptide repeat protein [Flavobacterium sp. 1]|uniref:tetratricopeptide repeat-containing sensor histidine kinase n=1 Tax=Flavobacterium sp. 1 TaxID=2035200 RepID=UPI000C244641|nr:tetratricopeptide repeat protein [Flavobacterium sp. 1]PJJ07040.1 tetratricopeptide repeat protein [Flavobacterium sp. 1]
MITKKLHFPNFYLSLIVLLALFGCNKKSHIIKNEKSNAAYQIYIDYAEKYFADSQYNRAFFYYNKSKLACNPSEEKVKIIYSLLRMSAIQQIQGDYANSETSATEAISFFNKKTDNQYKIAIYNILGINYKSLFDYENAIYYYNQALKIAENELQKTILKNNIAVIYIDKQNYEDAIQILTPLLSVKEVIENNENYARVLDNLGFSYFKTGNSKKGLDYINQALKIRKQIKDDFGLTSSYQHLSEFYDQTNPVLSCHYAQLSYAKATKVNNVNDRLKSLKQLIKNSTGNQSKKFTEIYFRINDSLNKATQKAKNQFAKIKYDSTKEKNENLVLKAQKAENALELERQKNKNYVSYFFIFLGIITATFYYYYWQKKNKKEKQKAVYESETRISKKLHDELANDVYQTMAFAETQDLQNPIKKETLLGSLDKIYALTRNISRENSKIEMGARFEEELKEMLSGYNNDHVKIIIKDNGDINWQKIEPEKKIALHRVLQELMVNMKKHSQCSFAVISFDSNEKHIEINYSDDGVGIKDSLILKNGLSNVENRIHTINGTIIFDSETTKGFKVKIAIPK